MLPVLNLGPLALPMAPLLLMLGFWVGLELTERHAPRLGADPAPIFRMILLAMIAGLLGARLAYALQSLPAFIASPVSLLSPRPQMLDASGGLLAACLAVLIYGSRMRLPLWTTLDALTTLFALMAIALGLAHIASGDAYGAPARLPWSIQLWGAWRHPTQVYETLAAAMAAIAVWPGRVVSVFERARSAPGGAGLRFWSFTALTALARLFLEAFRGDSLLLFDRFRQAQVIAWLVLALAVWQILRRIRAVLAQRQGKSGLSPNPLPSTVQDD